MFLLFNLTFIALNIFLLAFLKKRSGRITSIYLNSTIVLLFFIGSVIIPYDQSTDVFFENSNIESIYIIFLILSSINIFFILAQIVTTHKERRFQEKKTKKKKSPLTLKAILLISVAVSLYLIFEHYSAYGLSGLFEPEKRSSIRADSALFVLMLGYVIPILALYFSYMKGGFKNKIFIFLVFLSSLSILVGFRGLFFSSLILYFISYANRRGISAKVFISTSAIIFTFIYVFTYIRPEADSGIINALMNRVFYTPFHQIQNAHYLYSYQDYPGNWIINDILKRFGENIETLQLAVWRLDYVQSEHTGGSYHYIGDLLGNFSYFSFLVYFFTCLLLFFIDKNLIKTLKGKIQEPKFINDIFLYITFRISFFTLSSSLIPTLILFLFIFILLRFKKNLSHHKEY